MKGRGGARSSRDRRVRAHHELETAPQCPARELIEEHLALPILVDALELGLRIAHDDAPLAHLADRSDELGLADALVDAGVEHLEDGQDLEVALKRDQQQPELGARHVVAVEALGVATLVLGGLIGALDGRLAVLGRERLELVLGDLGKVLYEALVDLGVA